MLQEIVYVCGIFFEILYYVSGHCVDIHSQIISQGLHYVPGPNSCTLCICDKGGPKWCKSVLCSQPQNCKSFQRGNSCCEFKCLDDILTANDTYKDTYDLALRLIASAVFVILTLSLLFFVIHRFRRHKLRVQQQRPLGDDQRSLNSIGYITGSLGYLPGNIGDLEFHYEESNGHFSLWKPPGNYFPRGEAPPPYEEAIRNNNVDPSIVHNQTLVISAVSDTGVQSHQVRSARCTPTRVQCRHQRLINRASNIQEYANVTLETENAQHTQPLIKLHKISNSVGHTSHSYMRTNQNEGITTEKTSKNCDSVEKSKSYENIVAARKSDKQTRVNDERKSSTQKNDAEGSKLDENKLMFLKYENFLVRNSIAKDTRTGVMVNRLPNESSSNNNEALYVNINRHDNTRHRTIPISSESHNKHMHTIKESRSKDNLFLLAATSKEYKDLSSHRTLPKNLKELTVSVSSNSDGLTNNLTKKAETDNCSHRFISKQSNCDAILSLNLIKSHINLTEKVHKDGLHSATFSSGNLENKVEEKSKVGTEHHSLFSYRSLSPSQDEDDYRSECENCKSAEVTHMEEEQDVFNETMTLQRRPETSEEVPYYRTSLTLPTQIRKPRAVTPNPGRNGWFMAMQEISSSEESE
ncbi:hypothetical protein PPYR_14385 [Photinus pyralis]|uniref:VWFC domain-containing protein n=3 Tax=Photinus pyralis TaxID=7054 RepID=A0A1Y1KFR4_PHOPY|nr:uncharacterized protein LOC116180548 [Photinus pyralis]KAB0792426.1 hypothetical protein PPYR_14385 [Photinus pyralis]